MEKKKEKQPISPNKPLKKEEARRDIGVIILNLLLAIVTILLLGYIAYRNGYIELDNILNKEEMTEEGEQKEGVPKEQSEEIETTDEQEEPLLLETYDGEYISAVLPLGWEIVEYLDGEGSEMLASETTYSGLTGMEILHEDSVIMKIEGISGIGFIGCGELPRFTDSSSEYEKLQEETNKEIEIDEEEIKYLDYTDVAYSEFQWFNKKYRRVGEALYYDTIEDDEYFQPQCEVSFFRIEELGFEMDGEYIGDTYMYTIYPDATQSQLSTLDQILTSMTTK
jgi:hypothetical protein